MVFNTIHINTYFNLEIALLWANMLVTPPPQNKKKPKKECVKGGGVDFTDFPSMQKNPMKSLLY